MELPAVLVPERTKTAHRQKQRPETPREQREESPKALSLWFRSPRGHQHLLHAPGSAVKANTSPLVLHDFLSVSLIGVSVLVTKR